MHDNEVTTKTMSVFCINIVSAKEIKRVKFSIGREPNHLKEDFNLAVSRLSAKLYTKDIHFLMELILPSSSFHRSLSFLFFERSREKDTELLVFLYVEGDEGDEIIKLNKCFIEVFFSQ